MARACAAAAGCRCRLLCELVCVGAGCKVHGSGGGWRGCGKLPLQADAVLAVVCWRRLRAASPVQLVSYYEVPFNYRSTTLCTLHAIEEAAIIIMLHLKPVKSAMA